VSARIDRMEWAAGASPEALAEALAEAALTVTVLGALLDDPKLREKAEAVLAAMPVPSGL